MSKTKRPHFVPVAYLLAWADERRQVAVRRRGTRSPITPNVTNVAVEAGVYGDGEHAQLREHAFGDLEQVWAELREALTSEGGLVGRGDRERISVFMALQFVRTAEQGAQFRFLRDFDAFSPDRPVDREAMRAFLRQHHLRFDPSEAELEAAWSLAAYQLNDADPPSRDEELGVLHDIAIKQIAPRFENYSWAVEHCSRPMLMTSDRPVMAWRPPSRKDAYEGIGLDGAVEIRFPITPTHLLVMQRHGSQYGIRQVQSKRFQRVNSGIASQCQSQLI